MAKRIFLLGIMAMVLVFGMTVIGCNNDNSDTDGDGNLTITGIPPEHNGRYVAFWSETAEGLDNLRGAISFNDVTETFTLPQIISGSVTIPMWTFDANYNSVRFSGNARGG